MEKPGNEVGFEAGVSNSLCTKQKISARLRNRKGSKIGKEVGLWGGWGWQLVKQDYKSTVIN
jgi:hypothetical protein